MSRHETEIDALSVEFRSHRWAETFAGAAFPLVCVSCLVRSDSHEAEYLCDHLADRAREAAVSPVERLRCYPCAHEFAGDRDRLATTCPKCGSDSFSRATLPGKPTPGGDA